MGGSLPAGVANEHPTIITIISSSISIGKALRYPLAKLDTLGGVEPWGEAVWTPMEHRPNPPSPNSKKILGLEKSDRYGVGHLMCKCLSVGLVDKADNILSQKRDTPCAMPQGWEKLVRMGLTNKCQKKSQKKPACREAKGRHGQTKHSSL